jgi:hypothetical protein
MVVRVGTSVDSVTETIGNNGSTVTTGLGATMVVVPIMGEIESTINGERLIELLVGTARKVSIIFDYNKEIQ